VFICGISELHLIFDVLDGNFERVVSQLDHAATQLSQQTALSRRMALILTDNAVELMLHHYASESLAQDFLCESGEELAKTRKIRDEVLGHQFVPKVNSHVQQIGSRKMKHCLPNSHTHFEMRPIMSAFCMKTSLTS
jgi:hypothetical protein